VILHCYTEKCCLSSLQIWCGAYGLGYTWLAMTTRYTAEQLWSFNRDVGPPPRSVRKAIFSFRLWLPKRHRPADKQCTGIRLGLLNVRSVTERLVALSDVITTRRLDVFTMSETWHQTSMTIDLGVIIDGELTMERHVRNVVCSCFYHLRQLRSVRRSLTVEARRTLAAAFVATRVDYCNAVFYGVLTQVTHRLQMVLNAAARLVVGAGKFDRITPVLCDVLHWLPVLQRIQFKVASAAYDCPRHLASLLRACIHAGDRHCWSVKPPFDSARRRVCAMDEDRIWLAQFPRRGSSCLERASNSSPLNHHFSWTVQSWVEDLPLQPCILHRQPLRTFVEECIDLLLTYT